MVWRPIQYTAVILPLLALAGGGAPGDAARTDSEARSAELSPDEEARLREAARLRGASLADMEDGNFGRAAASLEQLAVLLPDNILPPINLAICYSRLDRSRAALEQIRRARTIDSDNPQMLYTFARLLERDGNARGTWQEILDAFATAYPTDPRPYYLRALRAEEEGHHPEAVRAYSEALRRSPENLVLMVEGLVVAAEAADLGATSDALDAIEDRLNGFDGQLATLAEQLRDSIDTEQSDALRPRAHVLRNVLRPSDLYQLGLVQLTGGRGSSGALFPQLDFDPPLPKSIQGGQDIDFAFVDASLTSAIARPEPAWFLRPYRGGAPDQVAELTPAGLVVRPLEGERFEAEAIELEPAPDGPFLSFDVDQDGISDLVALVGDSGLVLYTGKGDNVYSRGRVLHSGFGVDTVEDLYPLDLDHDGDLDLFLARREASDLYLQNNGDGTWSERSHALGLAGPQATTTDLAVADFDEDGDLDLVVSRADQPPSLYLNSLTGAFFDASSDWSLPTNSIGTGGMEVADFDNDGLFDLLHWGDHGLELLSNRAGTFERQDLLGGAARQWSDAATGDFDNDGDQDVVLLEDSSASPTLFRNRGGRLEPEEMQPTARQARELHAGDLDDDGDLDLTLLSTDGERHFWRNDGADRNQWLRLRLQGLHDNNSKNNTQGLFVRLEIRIGDAVYTVLGNGGNNHLGLGSARQADVVRVVWTNGLAQTWLQVSANQTLVEKQVLKGSCPMLFTWTGEGFEFHTDLMWRSTLGMKLADGSTGSLLSARDYVLIPGPVLRPAQGDLWLQVTEELWETIYVDQMELIVIDHPAEVDLLVDERFTPPPFPDQAPMYWLETALPPTAATDERGQDIVERLLQRDGIYVDDLPLSRFQGLTEGHELRLTFDEVPPGRPLRLVLWGWIFPTDSTINSALAQAATPLLRAPSLEVLEADGSWRTLLPFLGLPNGKRKALVLELPEELPSSRLTLRIATSMQIYWDAALLAVGDPQPPTVATRLEISEADLHYRGFSRRYRASSSGPHLFDYERTSIGPRFRDMRGTFTRYGPVQDLVRSRDARYVIMNAGDELSLRFDARKVPALRDGWRRDYILFTDGWVKDADLHTAYSSTVAPLPHHLMRTYSEAESSAFADTPSQREVQARYQTREVSDAAFRDALRRPEAVLLSLQDLDLTPRD